MVSPLIKTRHWSVTSFHSFFDSHFHNVPFPVSVASTVSWVCILIIWKRILEIKRLYLIYRQFSLFSFLPTHTPSVFWSYHFPPKHSYQPPLEPVYRLAVSTQFNKTIPHTFRNQLHFLIIHWCVAFNRLNAMILTFSLSQGEGIVSLSWSVTTSYFHE